MKMRVKEAICFLGVFLCITFFLYSNNTHFLEALTLSTYFLGSLNMLFNLILIGYAIAKETYPERER